MKPAATTAAKAKSEKRNGWVWLDLNQRPHAYQACALTD